MIDRLIEGTPPREKLLSTDAVRLSAEATGGPALWFLWAAGSDQTLAHPLPGSRLSAGWPTISVSPPGRYIELDARLLHETLQQWWSAPRPKTEKAPVLSLGQRLAELRERIVTEGEPLLSSWDDVDRELGDRRGYTAGGA